MGKEYIIKVAPLVRLPIARTQVFSYWFNSPIERGSLVEIPFYNRFITGIVVESRGEFRRQSAFQLKRIKRVIEENLISEKQIEFAENLSGYYLSPLGIVLKFMVPKAVKVRKSGERQPVPKFEVIKKNKSTENITQMKDREIAIIGSKEERDQMIFSFMKLALKKKKQCLYLTSEIFPLEAFFEKIKKIFPADKIALVHGAVPKGEMYESWKRVKSGEVKIIIASKTGVFLPLNNLSTVLIEESGDISHKQWDMNPRYNAVKAAQILADVHGAKLIFSSALLTVELWRKKIRTFDVNENKNVRPEVRIINVFQEKKKADFPIGGDLYELLSKVINKKNKALLVVNRRGFSSFSVCRNCKNVLRCPNCNRALVYFEEKEKYRCSHCSHKVDLLSACPACGACQFSHRGVGIQLVEKKIRRLFPSARILRVDSDISKSRKRNEKILGNLMNGNFDILIGTQIALKLGVFQRLDLVAFPNFEDLGNIPDFNTRELVFAMLNQAKGIIRNGGVVLVQTGYPDNFLLTAFQNQENETFFEKEMKERKKMDYPPFSRLVKIFYCDKSKKKVDAETKKIFDLLAALSNSNIDVSEPHEPFSAKKRGYYYKNILIRIKPDSDIRRLPIFSVLSGLKKGWTMDVDPISTI